MTGEKNKLLRTIRSKAFLKSLIVLIIGILLLSSPLILFLGNLSFNRALEIKKITYLDADEDGLYDGLKFDFSLPIQNAFIRDIIFYQSGLTFNWKVLPEHGTVKKNSPSFTIYKNPSERQIMPNANLGIAIIYSLTGSMSSISTYVYRTKTPFQIPEGGDYYIGVYYNLSHIGGLIDRDNSEVIYLTLRDSFKDYTEKKVKVFRVTDESIALYMNLFVDDQYWLLFSSDTLPSDILPSINEEEGPLLKYIKNGGNIAFLGGEPLRFVSGSGGYVKISDKLRDKVFPKVYDLAPGVVDSKASLNYYTELGKVVMDKTSIDTFSSSFPVDIRYINDSRYSVEVFAKSVDGRYADPALMHYRYGADILFSFLGPVTDPERAETIASDTALIMQYLFERDDPSKMELTMSQQVDLDGDGRVEDIRLNFINKKKFDFITSATLQDQGSDTTLYLSKQTDGSDIRTELEILAASKFSVGDSFTISLEVDRNYDQVVDFTYSTTISITSAESVDLLMYSDLNFDPIGYTPDEQKTMDGYLTTEANNRGLDVLHISPVSLSYIIENGITSTPIILVSEAVPDELFSTDKIRNWIDAGGVISSISSYLGAAILQPNTTTSGGSYYLEAATGIPQSAIVSGDFFFRPTYVSDIFGNFDSFPSQFGLNVNALRDNNVIALAVSENIIGSFIFSSGSGNYVLIPSADMSESGLSQSNYAENLFSIITGTDQFSSQLNGTIVVDSISWFSINDTSEIQLAEITLHSYVYNFTDIDEVLVDGVPTTISSSHLISGINNKITVLLDKSNYVANNSVVNLTIQTNGSLPLSIDLTAVSSTPDFLLFKDPRISNFFTYEEILLPDDDSNSYVRIGEGQMVQIMLDNLFPTIVNSHDFLPTQLYNGEQNSSLFTWIQAGGNYIHIAPLFGLVVHNESGFSIYDETVYENTFGVTPFIYLPFTYVEVNGSSTIVTNYLIDVDSMSGLGYNVSSLLQNENYTVAAKITGTGSNGFSLGQGSLTIISTYFTIPILRLLQLQLLEVINL